ncbi:MAG TPA: class I SAM-dependent methyltransferase [Candidatus Sulfotelmatobacter sp.]|nr:class I SAM-dependent methyltransferase [Candidatus Sulfotelmatobacter sp.]
MRKQMRIRTSCRICGNKKLLNFIRLTKMPLADLFIKNLKQKEHKFPLDVKVCSKCFLVQLVDEVNPDLLFSQNYAFYTGGSPSSIEYFENYAKSIMKRFPKESKKFIVEIASNDGTLLRPFLKKKYRALGIDPAKNVVEEANLNGIPTIANFFNEKSANGIVSSEGRANILIANNVVAHVRDLHDFMKGIKNLLDENGVFIFECQYFPYLLFNNQFDNIYHEHHSFFSLFPLVKLLKKHRLEAFDVEEHDTQGGSIRVFVSHKGKRKIQKRLENALKNEIDMGITNIETYLGFQARVDYIKIKLLQILKDLKKKNKRIAGYGASAKSNTLLNYCGIGTNYLDYIVDKTPYKYGLYSPGMHVRVISQEEEQKKKRKPDYYLLLVWNYAEKIIEREEKFIKRGGKFIFPIPTPYIR